MDGNEKSFSFEVFFSCGQCRFLPWRWPSGHVSIVSDHRHFVYSVDYYSSTWSFECVLSQQLRLSNGRHSMGEVRFRRTERDEMLRIPNWHMVTLIWNILNYKLYQVSLSCFKNQCNTVINENNKTMFQRTSWHRASLATALRSVISSRIRGSCYEWRQCSENVLWQWNALNRHHLCRLSNCMEETQNFY